MHFAQFAYTITEYKITSTETFLDYLFNKTIILYIQYSYKLLGSSSLNSHKNIPLMFRFNEKYEVYKLITTSPLELTSLLVNDGILINKENNYYLTSTTLLRVL